jgi:DNA-binding CsgD family transcriptional regulator
MLSIDYPESSPVGTPSPAQPGDACGFSIFWVAQDEIAGPDGSPVLRKIPALRHSRITRQTFDELARGEVAASRSSAAHSGAAKRPPALNRLTDRERTVLSLLVRGYGNQQIAKQMGISIHGAKRHVSNLLIKFDCRNRTEVALAAIELGIVSPQEIHGVSLLYA